MRVKQTYPMIKPIAKREFCSRQRETSNFLRKNFVSLFNIEILPRAVLDSTFVVFPLSNER